jgi:O-antigen/teichoic acid export membrane protein
MINHRADVIMVGFFKGTTDAGIYSVSVHWANLMVWGLTAVNLVAAPLISQLYTQNKIRELQRMASLSALGIAIFTLPAAIIMLFCGTWLLGLFGDGFKAGYGALVFLVAGQSVNALTGSVGYLLTMTGHQKEAAIVIGITAFINISLNVILIPMMGLKGAAIATMISTMIWKFAMYVIVRRNLKIDPSIVGLFGKRNRNEQH